MMKASMTTAASSIFNWSFNLGPYLPARLLSHLASRWRYCHFHWRSVKVQLPSRTELVAVAITVGRNSSCSTIVTHSSRHKQRPAAIHSMDPQSPPVRKPLYQLLLIAHSIEHNMQSSLSRLLLLPHLQVS